MSAETAEHVTHIDCAVLPWIGGPDRWVSRPACLCGWVGRRFDGADQYALAGEVAEIHRDVMARQVGGWV